MGRWGFWLRRGGSVKGIAVLGDPLDVGLELRGVFKDDDGRRDFLQTIIDKLNTADGEGKPSAAGAADEGEGK
jgi:hypothetical protein